jgi:hypothetical protein
MNEELVSPDGFMYLTTKDEVFRVLHIGVWAGGLYHYIDAIIGWDFS